jgi:uncharacterized protein YqeY
MLTQIDADLKQAMRDRDETKKLALRSLKTALTEAQKSGENHTLTDDEVLKIIAKSAKQRRDAIVEYEKANRPELAEKEAAELVVLERYLPQQLSESEIEAIVREVIAETGATSLQDLSRVMPIAMQRTRGQAEGRAVNAVVRRLLS